MAASLAEKYAELANTTPVLQDPEDDIHYETRARLTDKYEEDESELYFGTSHLRQRNVISLADDDARYSGKKVSRKALQEDEGSDIVSDSQGSEDEESGTAESEDALSEDDDHENDDDEDDDDEDDDDDDTELTLVPEKDMIQKFSQINLDQEIEKGKAVQTQLAIWDMLLECRIKMQKMLSLSNCLPQTETWDTFVQQGGDDYHQAVQKNRSAVKQILVKLLTMQDDLMQRNPEMTHIVTGNQKKVTESTPSDEEITSESDQEDEGQQASESDDQSLPNKVSKRKRKLQEKDIPVLLEKRYKCFSDYRNSTIQKWNDKTRLASGKLNQKSFASFEQSAVKQIEQILNDRDRLRKRTQLKRSTYRVLGKPDNKEKEDFPEAVDFPNRPVERLKKNDHLKDYDPEIFDDDDFYHQLLRELIERKTADVKDPIAMSRQWLEIQKLRSKIKKKVDTKASKGRKIRFDVHPKLVNFMAPIDQHEMTDEAKNELFRSLFGNPSIQAS